MNVQERVSITITQNNLDLLKKEVQFVSKDNQLVVKAMVETEAGRSKVSLASQINRIEENAHYLNVLASRL